MRGIGQWANEPASWCLNWNPPHKKNVVQCVQDFLTSHGVKVILTLSTAQTSHLVIFFCSLQGDLKGHRRHFKSSYAALGAVETAFKRLM